MAFRPTCAPAWAFPTRRNSNRAPSLRGAQATKQSTSATAEGLLDCFASLAMTEPHESSSRKQKNMSSSKFDIVVYGATGFTGQLVAEYLAAHYKGDAQSEMGDGRAQQGQARVRPRCDRRAGGHAADRRRRRRSGFAEGDGRADEIGDHHGRPVSALMATNCWRPAWPHGTDYFDLCGEPVWMRQMIDKHEAAAKASGARIVFSCGFDSVPFELGAFYRAGGSQAGVRRAGCPRQGPRARHERHAFRRHRGERQGDLRGGGQGSQPRCDAQGPIRADARIQGPEAAAGQQAGATRKTCSPGPRRS